MSSEASTLLGLLADDDRLRMRPERFREALESLGRPEGPAVPNSGLGADADRILRIFVRNGKLVQIPAVHPDYAALRRYLVDDEFLHRRDGFYWRAGGTFEVDDPLRDKG